jgi:hypothetical protein
MLLFPNVADAVAVARYIAQEVVYAHMNGQDPAAPVYHLLYVVDKIFAESVRAVLMGGQEKVQVELGDNPLAGPYKPTEEVLKESS